ncbi:MAG: hypothetical protein ABIS59_02690, partial [Candidatus Saccharibacteria bacterium]
GITGLVRAAYHSERVLKTFKMAKLPYDLISLLKENLADIFDSKMVVEILNENNLNYDPTYRSLVLFFSVDADKMKVYTHKQVQLKWFSRSDIMTANEQDGRIIGIDDLHLKVLSDLIKK